MDHENFPYFSRGNIKNLYARTDFAVRKKWGQNFLTDPNHTAKIVSLLKYHDLPVMETGAGLGALTWTLLEKNYKVFSIEIDPFLCGVLEDTFSRRNGFTLIEGDALQILSAPDPELESLIQSDSCIFAGNLPYYITTDLITLMARRTIWRESVFLVQKEYAQRITAPGARSSVRVYLNNLAEWQYCHEVPSTVFFPQPSVDSAVVRAERRIAPFCDPDVLEKLLRISYRGKRKKIYNSWKMGECGLWSPEILKSEAKNLGFPADLRPEEWEAEHYYSLAKSLSDLL